MAQRTEIRVGQRLIRWDGTRGYVALNSQGTRVCGPGEPFLVEWLGLDGHTAEDAASVTLEDLEREGIRFGKGVIPWARSVRTRTLGAITTAWRDPDDVIPRLPGRRGTHHPHP
jgi:hypothetical protein